ncbi:putative phage abortive infection protein [bacterium]|nr:putative phage abortive infection protein [bacterium]
MQRQQFEATFFQMLNYFIAYRNEMDIGDKNRPKKGTAMFESFNANLHYFYSEEYRIITSPSFQSILNTTWERFRQSSATIIDLYFGLLLRVIRYAHSKAPQEAEMYIHIVRDSLTNEELSVLFFAGASKRYEDLKGLIERYGLLRNHDNHKIVQLPGGPHNFYERKAYR